MRNLALFLLTAGFCMAALGAFLPPFEYAVTRAKLEAFAERKDEVELIVLGSSQSYRGFDPRVFDAALAREGLETRSFNFGVPGTAMAESHAFLERVARLEPANLRWVLVEAERIARMDDEGQFLTAKNIAWHDFETTRLMWPYFEELDGTPAQRWRGRWHSGVAFAYNVLGIGRGVPWIESALGIQPDESELAGERRDGFQLMEDASGPRIRRRREDYLARRAVFKHQMNKLTAERRVQRPEASAARPFFSRTQELARAMGAEAIFFTIRHGYRDCAAHVLSENGELPDLIHFDDVQRYPELFDVELTFDGKHFDRVGASIFSEYLATAFAELLESRAR